MFGTGLNMLELWAGNTFTLDPQAFGSVANLGVWDVSTDGNADMVIGILMPFVMNTIGDTVDLKDMDLKVDMVDAANPMKFNEKADAYLDALYKSVGASTPEQRYNTLILKLGYDHQFIGFSHNPSWEQKQAMLEYDILEREGLIEMVYV